jgi:hypothetical protein
MVGPWCTSAALAEFAASRVRNGVDAKKVRESARSATRLYQVASIVGAALLLIGGALSV